MEVPPACSPLLLWGAPSWTQSNERWAKRDNHFPWPVALLLSAQPGTLVPSLPARGHGRPCLLAAQQDPRSSPAEQLPRQPGARLPLHKGIILRRAAASIQVYLLTYCEMWTDFSREKKPPKHQERKTGPGTCYSFRDPRGSGPLDLLSSLMPRLRLLQLCVCGIFPAKCLIQGKNRFPHFFGMIIPGGNNWTLIQEIVPNTQIKFFFVLFPPLTYNYNLSFMLNNYFSVPLWGSYIPQIFVGCSIPQATLVTI